MKCLYLTDLKPSRRMAREFADWLKATYPGCMFTEVNVDKKAYPVQNGGRYQGRVDGPGDWEDNIHASDRRAVFEAARRLLTP